MLKGNLSVTTLILLGLIFLGCTNLPSTPNRNSSAPLEAVNGIDYSGGNSIDPSGGDNLVGESFKFDSIPENLVAFQQRKNFFLNRLVGASDQIKKQLSKSSSLVEKEINLFAEKSTFKVVHALRLSQKGAKDLLHLELEIDNKSSSFNLFDDVNKVYFVANVPQDYSERLVGRSLRFRVTGSRFLPSEGLRAPGVYMTGSFVSNDTPTSRQLQLVADDDRPTPSTVDQCLDTLSNETAFQCIQSAVAVNLENPDLAHCGCALIGLGETTGLRPIYSCPMSGGASVSVSPVPGAGKVGIGVSPENVGGIQGCYFDLNSNGPMSPSSTDACFECHDPEEPENGPTWPLGDPDMPENPYIQTPQTCNHIENENEALECCHEELRISPSQCVRRIAWICLTTSPGWCGEEPSSTPTPTALPTAVPDEPNERNPETCDFTGSQAEAMECCREDSRILPSECSRIMEWICLTTRPSWCDAEGRTPTPTPTPTNTPTSDPDERDDLDNPEEASCIPLDALAGPIISSLSYNSIVFSCRTYACSGSTEDWCNEVKNITDRLDQLVDEGWLVESGFIGAFTSRPCHKTRYLRKLNVCSRDNP